MADGFLPINRTEMEEKGLSQMDFVYICGDAYVDTYVDALGHKDENTDGYCDACDELLDPTIECECNCHNDGISGFFWKIKIFFSKLFRTNKMCECGVVHY